MSVGPKRAKQPIQSPGKAMADLRIHLECIVRNNVGRLDADLAQLEAKERINALIKLLEYVMPKQRETTAHVDGELTQTIETSLSNIEDLFKTKSGE